MHHIRAKLFHKELSLFWETPTLEVRGRANTVLIDVLDLHTGEHGPPSIDGIIHGVREIGGLHLPLAGVTKLPLGHKVTLHVVPDCAMLIDIDLGFGLARPIRIAVSARTTPSCSNEVTALYEFGGGAAAGAPHRERAHAHGDGSPPRLRRRLQRAAADAPLWRYGY